MAYSMQYGKFRFDKCKEKRKKPRIVIVIMVLIFVITLRIFYPNQLNKFQKAAFPFFEDNVQQSFADMARSIKEGDSLETAVKTFCEEILEDASN